jgi:hypothetical protein
MILYKAISDWGDIMKIWTKVHIKDKNKKVELIAKALTNYLYGYGPILDISRKYNINQEDRSKLNQYTANRIAGLLMLYLTKDYKRINDIANKYNIDASYIKEIVPEIEGYIER